MSDPVLVYATFAQATLVRPLLGAAAQATGLSVRLELYGSGSLFQRLGPRHAPPLPDVVLWNGPLAAHAAAQSGLLQPYQPPRVPDGVLHHPGWLWTTLDERLMMASSVKGATSVGSLAELAGVPRLALADPERAEAGMLLLLASLDRARQVEGDVERGWTWWQQRAQAGLALFEDEASARAATEPGGPASHALTLAGGSPAATAAAAASSGPASAASGPAPAPASGAAAATPGSATATRGSAPRAGSSGTTAGALAGAASGPGATAGGVALAANGSAVAGLAPIPNAASLAANARNRDAARRLLDWLTGEAAAAHLPLSPWQAATNGLQAARTAAPPFDVEWATQQYNAVRRRWAASAYGPTLAS